MSIDEGLSGRATLSDYVVICGRCGFWFGRGTKDQGFGLGAEGGRGALGLIHAQPLDKLDVTLPEVLRALKEEEALLDRIDPFKAEELVCHLLKEAYGWEVRHIGGRKDRGIDALAIIENAKTAIIQVKWRRDHKRAESVSLVREFAGTLLARGIPSGIVVTTRERFSPDADAEIAQIRERRIDEIGRIDIEYRTYLDLLSMLDIASRPLIESPIVPVRPNGSTYYIFDGNGIWDRNHNYVGMAAQLGERPEWTNPLEVLI
jgi:hypothetical protein